MAALLAPVAVVAPRVAGPKARAPRTLRASAFRGARVTATPKLMARSTVRVAAMAETKINTDEVLKTIADKWEDTENKSAVITYVAGGAAIVWLSGTVVGAINAIPVLPKVMELVGLGYSTWFVYRYVLFKDSRKELVEQFDALKDKVSGEL
uniref:Cyanobacterial aminoacyl-tRNA synthetase CAAD domain-containing protein n=1 Tax=Mantoniella antarctica TaxID=81844 RepID=A0A7S0SCP8_9CHLO